MTDKYALLAAVRVAVAESPDIVGDIVSAAISGQRDHIDKINSRRAELERAWLSALVVMQADRIAPGLKKMLLASLVPVLERYGLERECKTVRDAHALATGGDQ